MNGDDVTSFIHKTRCSTGMLMRCFAMCGLPAMLLMCSNSAAFTNYAVLLCALSAILLIYTS